MEEPEGGVLRVIRGIATWTRGMYLTSLSLIAFNLYDEYLN